MSKKLELEGKRFGRLVAICDSGERRANNVKWLCKCDCGNYVKVEAVSLRRGNTISCGCYNIENFTQRITKHGDYKTRLYSIYRCMKNRCNNKNNTNYKTYGAIGIKVCEEWMDNYFNFKEWAVNNGYQETLTLDRIDVNKGYSPTNCRWVDYKTQGNNKRTNHYITYKGKKQTLTQWAEQVGMKPNCLQTRLSRGWSVERALTEVVHR